MKMTGALLLLIFFIILSVLSVFLTAFVLYVFGEFFFLFYKGVPVNFTVGGFFIICKISFGVGSFVGVGMWVARSLKLRGF